MPVAPPGKNPVRLYSKLQNQPIGLRKIFIDYFFFQVDQWDCTKPLSIFDRLASSEERFRTFHCTNKLQSQPTGLPKKIFIDYLFFQADQSECTKSVSILIDLLPLKNVEIRTFLAKFVALEFSHSWFRMAC